MNLNLIGQYIRRAVSNFIDSILLNTLTVMTIVLAMLILSLFLLIFNNLGNFLSYKQKDVEISVYLADGILSERLLDLNKIIKSKDGVFGVRFISKEEARNSFLEWNKRLGQAVGNIDENPFPASFEIKLDPKFSDIGKIKDLVRDLKNLSGIENVDYSFEWHEKIKTFVKILRTAGIFIFIFLSIAVAFLISNTIRLNIYGRREEIAIMRMVGATNFFIKIPFLLEGFMQGVLGVLGALGILFASYILIKSNLENSLNFLTGGSGFHFLPKNYILFVLALGILVGLLGANFAVRRFLRREI